MANRMYISVAEAEELTGISQWTWRAWAYNGKCASVKTGSQKQARLLIPVTEVDRLMTAGLRPAIHLHRMDGSKKSHSRLCGRSANEGDGKDE